MKLHTEHAAPHNVVDCGSVNACWYVGASVISLRHPYSGAEINRKDVPAVIEALQFYYKERE